MRGIAALMLLVHLAAASLLAQNGIDAPSLPGDSLDRARDSTLNAAYLLLGTDSTRAEEYHKIIQIHKARKQTERQVRAAERLVATLPDSAYGWFLLGDAHLDNSYPDRAIIALKHALELSPIFVRARVILAESYTILKQYDSALAQLDTALMHNNRNADAHLRRAELLETMGRWQETIADYRAAAELLPERYEPWMKFAEKLYKAGIYDEAITATHYVMKLNPESANALLLLADSQAAAGLTDEAVRNYQQFIYRFPKHPRALEAERIARELGWRP
jgi:tetratricopeptide (TPR) repeat protein